MKGLDHCGFWLLIICHGFVVQDNHAQGRELVEHIPSQFLSEARHLWLLGANEQKTVSLFQHGVNRQVPISHSHTHRHVISQGYLV